MIGGRRPLQGRKPADRRVRVERPHAPYFRYTGPGQMVAKAAASTPKTAVGRTGPGSAGSRSAGRWRARRRSASGSRRRRRSRSSARTRSARRPTRPRRSCASWSWPARASLVLRARRSRSRSRSCSRSSRSRTARSAAPTRSGGGAYVVSRENLGRHLASSRPRALLIDYVMTVAVSTTSAVEQIISVVPDAERRCGIEIGVVVDRPDHGRQPARPARVRQHLRDPDLPVPGLGAADDRDRRRPGSLSGDGVPVVQPDRRSTDRDAEPIGHPARCSAPSPAARSP